MRLQEAAEPLLEYHLSLARATVLLTLFDASINDRRSQPANEYRYIQFFFLLNEV